MNFIHLPDKTFPERPVTVLPLTLNLTIQQDNNTMQWVQLIRIIPLARPLDVLDTIMRQVYISSDTVI